MKWKNNNIQVWTIEKCFEQNAARMHKIWLDGDFVGSVKKKKLSTI